MVRVLLLASAALMALAGCRDAPDVHAPDVPAPARSAASLDLAQGYARLEARLIAQGALRTDGMDVPVPDTGTLLETFQVLAYTREGQGDGRATGGLIRWDRPVRISASYGASVPAGVRADNTRDIRQYAARLGRITGHPVRYSDARPNFHVRIAGLDDRAETLRFITRVAPDSTPETLDLLSNLPAEITCLVVTFFGDETSFSPSHALALIRAETPPLMRRACIHEELAQGLGLIGDSPHAHPSIFNDDYEFAHLTRHDEVLLRLLYGPNIRPGMAWDQVHPVLLMAITGGNN